MVRVKRAILILLVIAAAMFFGVLERESVLVQDAMRKDLPVISRMLYPCETWIRQSGGGPPSFSCVKAIRE